MKSDRAISSDSLKLGADWLHEQREYVVRQLEGVLRNGSVEERAIARSMVDFYRSEELANEIQPGFVAVREVRQ